MIWQRIRLWIAKQHKTRTKQVLKNWGTKPDLEDKEITFEKHLGRGSRDHAHVHRSEDQLAGLPS